jgi:fibronectin type III domain protein
MTTPTVTPMNGGATISWVGQTCRLPIASYTVTVQPGNIVVNLPGTASSTTVTGLTNGTTYTATVTATNADGTDSNSTTLVPSAPCTAATLAATPPSPGPTGGSIVFQGGSSSCTNPTYRFWIQPPGGAWQVTRWYSSSSTFTWTDTSVAGAYRAEVDVRQQSSSVDYDTTTNVSYSLAGCTAARLAASPTSPQPPGTTVSLTGSSTCPGTPQYRFWIRPPGGSWGIVQDFGSGNTYSWNTMGRAQGTYSLEVDVRDAGSAAVYEAVYNTTYVLGPATCHGATLSASPASPGATGSTVLFTGGLTGCPNPRYRFWVAPPGGAWSVVQNYSATNTFTWSGTGAPGTYRFEVDVRDASSPASYDTVSNLAYVLAGCSSAQLATDKSSPQLVGTASVTLTGSASCPGTAEYRFWVRGPGSAWSVVQNYSPSATLTWNTSSLGAGTYSLEVDVRDHGATASYESVANVSFTLARCTAPALNSDKASPQAAGTTITFSASASCTGTPQYRFWVRAPGGAWTIVQNYGSSATFVWNTTGKPTGVYAIEVDVRNAGSTVSYEAVTNSTYTLN